MSIIMLVFFTYITQSPWNVKNMKCTTFSIRVNIPSPPTARTHDLALIDLISTAEALTCTEGSLGENKEDAWIA